MNPWLNFDLDLTRSIRAIFPATLLWGASFPLALAAAAANREDPARLTGEVYAANTAGSIVGALAFSLLLIPAIGTQGSQQVLIWLAAAAAVVAVAPLAIKKSTGVRGCAGLRGRAGVGLKLRPWARFPGRLSLMAAASRLSCGAWIAPTMPKPLPCSWARESIRRW